MGHTLGLSTAISISQGVNYLLNTQVIADLIEQRQRRTLALG
jgi:hypothetical protein